LGDLRGGFVLATTTDLPAGDAIVVRLDGTVPRGGCGSAPGAALGAGKEAFAILAGLSPDALAGVVFPIDPAGWLRAAHRGTDWNDPAVLNAALRTLREQPISGSLGGIHVHGQ